MSLEVEATYENGVLTPDEPLPFKEQERVIVQVKAHNCRVWKTAGGLRWTGDSEVLRQIAEDPELRAAESA